MQLHTTRRLIAIFCSASVIAIAGCGASDNSTTSPDVAESFRIEEGLAQKGALLRGSTVIVNSLNAVTWAPNGASYTFSTTDDYGRFRPASATFNSQYVETTAFGYYFNEITGQTSTDIATLRGLSDLRTDRAVNLNVITDAIVARMRVLMTRAVNRLTFPAARVQATRELLNAFYIYNSADLMPGGSAQPANANEIDLARGRSAEDALAAISAVVIEVGKNGQGVTAFLVDLEADLADDGLVNNSIALPTSLRQRIDEAASKIDFSAVASNLNALYRTTGFDRIRIGGWIDSSNGADQVSDRFKFTALGTAGLESRSPAYIAGSDDAGQCISVSSGRLYRGSTLIAAATVKAVRGEAFSIGLTPTGGSVSGFIQRSAPSATGVCPTTIPATGIVRLAKSTVRASTSGTFGVKTDVGTGATPLYAITGDFNGDGKLDVATANYFGGSVSIHLGDGAGAFSPRTDYAVGAYPRGIASGDFNGDGRLDLAVANFGPQPSDYGNVSVLLGDGNGGFSTQSQYPTGVGPTWVTTADINSDGRLDLVVANYRAASVSMLLGDGQGGFGSKSDISTGINPYSVALGDLNGDGRLDMVIAVSATATASVLLGDGLGGFGSRSDYSINPSNIGDPFVVALADVNGDRRLDLVAAESLSNLVSVRLGDGSGGFGSMTSFPVGASPQSVAVADLNGDGNLDIVTANYAAGTVSVLIGEGPGTFAPKVDYVAGTGAWSVAIGRIDADALLDLVVANNSGANTFAVLRGQP